MTAPVTAATRVLALLGDPVSHSLSPVFQNAAIRALGLDGVYVALRCSAEDLPGLLRALARAGGGGNVTVPHKGAAAAAVERRTDAVEATGACNSFWMEDGEIWGGNTDVEGVTAAIRSLMGRSIAGARVLLLGAGGAARAAAYALATHAAGEIVILNRTPERAREMQGRFARPETRIRVAATPRELGTDGFDLAIHATSLGLRADDPLPLDPGTAPQIDAALDLVYTRTGETPWVRAMRERGVPTADGTEMLLQQGAAAFRRWWGVDPPLKAMREALAGAQG
ncbi:MAG TPA: shikimate dehydrogenase [Longimicrobiaceae bacterium]